VGDNPKQLERIYVYFNESSSKRFVPRALLVDMEAATINHLRSSPFGKLYKPDNVFMVGREGGEVGREGGVRRPPLLLVFVCL